MSDAKAMKKQRREMELDELIGPVIACLQDKLSEVRIAAERTCELLATYTTFELLQDYTKNLKKGTHAGRSHPPHQQSSCTPLLAHCGCFSVFARRPV